MRLICFLILFLVLNGCTWDTKLEPINEYALIHDNSSKVWMVNRLLKGDKDFTPLQFEYRQLIVFHKTSNAYFYTMRNLGEKPGAKMYFWLDRSKDEFGFRDSKHEFLFSISRISRSKIILKPKKKSYKYTIELIPFPEY